MELVYLRASLVFVYRLMVASESLLDFALSRTKNGLREYYEKHLEEERGHAEMLLSDLKGMGISAPPPSHLAAELAGSQYYLIAHDEPALLLGYMHALESSPMSVEKVEELQDTHKVRLSALLHHAKHDPEHALELKKQIEQLPEEVRRGVMWNRQYCMALLAVAERQLQERGWVS